MRLYSIIGIVENDKNVGDPYFITSDNHTLNIYTTNSSIHYLFTDFTGFTFNLHDIDYLHRSDTDVLFCAE